jgi:hypothetical protein
MAKRTLGNEGILIELIDKTLVFYAALLLTLRARPLIQPRQLVIPEHEGIIASGCNRSLGSAKESHDCQHRRFWGFE